MRDGILAGFAGSAKTERIGDERAAGERAEPVEAGAQSHDLADDDHRRRFDAALGGIGGGARQGGLQTRCVRWWRG